MKPIDHMDLNERFFGDVMAGEWWFGAMLVAVEAGVMAGYPDHTFRGDQPVTRNEVAVVLGRVMALAEQKRDVNR